MKDPVDINAATISNSGFIGVPLISATFGEEAVFICLLLWLLIILLPDFHCQTLFS